MSAEWLVQFRVKIDKIKGKDWPDRNDMKLANADTEYTWYRSFPYPTVKDSLQFFKKAIGGGHSKQIGSDFERKVVKTLSTWWGSDFRRTPSSGGWDKLSSDGRVNAAGDIWVPPDANFPFCVECKKRKEPLDFFSPLSDSSDNILDWWKQCNEDALRANKAPLLIMRCANREYVAFQPSHIDLLDSTGASLPDYRGLIFHSMQAILSVMRFEDFLISHRKKI